MLPFEAHRPRGAKRPKRRPVSAAIERLEERRVLSYSPIGFSPPDLTVVGQAPPIAAWGGPITVSVDVVNIGHNSMVEPLALAPGAISRADAPPSSVGVYLSRNPVRLTHGAIKLGDIPVPMLPQNSVFELTQTFAMPAQAPRRFPVGGGELYVYFRADEYNQTFDIDRTNNLKRAPEPVQMAPPLPQIEAIDVDLPPVMQPGDVVQPSFKIANYGTTPIAPQGPLVVQVVASTDPNYGPTDVILATYVIPDIAPLSAVPSRGPAVLGDVNLDSPINVETIIGDPIQLPPGPAVYNLGVVVDPLHQIHEISDLVGPRGSALQEVRRIGPRIRSLPPAGVLRAAPPPLTAFPNPAFGPIQSIYLPADVSGISGVFPSFVLRGTDQVTVRTREAETQTNSIDTTQLRANPFPSLPPGSRRFPGLVTSMR